MSCYDACPYCGREAQKNVSSNWFPVYTCNDCGEKFCGEDGPPCPECESSNCGSHDEVYA